MTETPSASSKCPTCNWHSNIEGLCSRCQSLLHSQLDDLIELWEEAHNQLQPGKGSGGGRSSERTIGVSVNALSFIQGSDILGLLHEWEKLIRLERGLTPPALIVKPDTLAQEITDAVRFMQVHLIWLGSTEYVEDFATELKELHAIGMTAAKKFVEKTTRIACPADREDGLTCGRMLKIEVKDEHGNERDPLSIFACRGCGSERSLLRLVAVALDTPGPQFWLHAAGIAQFSNMTEKNVHQFARRHGLKMRSQQYDLVAFRKRLKLDSA